MPQLTKPDAKVSVVMCTYNGERFLNEQLDSILKQTYPIHELIIQDDCSTDRTWEIIQEYASRVPMIRAYRNEWNIGFNRNFQGAMLRAEGDFVAIADQDDIWYPHKLERQVAAIGGHDLCFSAYHRDRVYSDSCHQLVLPEYNLERLMFVNCIPGHSMLVRRAFLQNPEHWNSHICYDWWFLVCAHFENGIACVPEPLNWHRPHAASAIATLHQKHARRKVTHPTYHPYLYGWHDLRALRHKTAWWVFYRNMLEKSRDTEFQLVHELSNCLVQHKVWKLCCLCLKHRDQIYPKQTGDSWKDRMRSFFYPLIYAYNNTNFEM